MRGRERPSGRERSLPPRGAWIEIAVAVAAPLLGESLPPRGAWIEIITGWAETQRQRSLPPRGAWIEMGHLDSNVGSRLVVAPPTGSVD